MRVTTYLNTSETEVNEKKHNIWLGLSLGNKYWTPEHIKTYVFWALEHTKEKVAILIPDKLQAINYEVKMRYKPARAMAVAMRKGLEIEKAVQQILKESKIDPAKVEIIHWAEIEDLEYHKTLTVLTREFEKNPLFRNAVITTVKAVPHMQALKLTDEQYVQLAKYVLDEMPVLLKGFTARESSFHYDLLPYPGLAKIDYLRDDLLNGVTFPDLTKELAIREKAGLIEAYAE